MLEREKKNLLFIATLYDNLKINMYFSRCFDLVEVLNPYISYLPVNHFITPVLVIFVSPNINK